jgi:hypothetical protein
LPEQCMRQKKSLASFCIRLINVLEPRAQSLVFRVLICAERAYGAGNSWEILCNHFAA